MVKGKIREFKSGAVRDTEEGKHDPEGFLNPLVIERYNQFMHDNRKQRNGKLRDSDNWQKGIPRNAYMKSLWRHFLDLWKWHRSYKINDTIQNVLCAIMFNTMGYLFEILKEKK